LADLGQEFCILKGHDKREVAALLLGATHSVNKETLTAILYKDRPMKEGMGQLFKYA